MVVYVYKKERRKNNGIGVKGWKRKAERKNERKEND